MKQMLVLLTILAITTKVAIGHDLQCFRCDDCPDPFHRPNELLITCTDIIIQPTPPSIDTSVPTVPPHPPIDDNPPPTVSDGYPSINVTVPTVHEQINISVPTVPGPPGVHPLPDLETVCFVLTHTVNSASRTMRGCVIRQFTDQLTCNLANDGIHPDSCTICTHNGCNTGSTMYLSVVALFTIIFITFVKL